MMGPQRLGVEKVPELQHHEGREEQTKFVELYSLVFVVKTVYEHSEHKHEEEQSVGNDALAYRRRYYELVAVAGLVVHHLARRWQRRQCHCCEGVHDEVHPQYLCHRQRHLRAYHRAAQYEQQCCHVDNQLEVQETLDVLIQRTSPHHGVDDRTEGVVEECHVRSLFCHTCSRA